MQHPAAAGGEMPVMSSYTSTSCGYDGTSAFSASIDEAYDGARNVALRRLDANVFRDQRAVKNAALMAAQLQEFESMASTLRIVRVYIADLSEQVPLDKRVIYRGDEITTDLTDQELFYEVPISTLVKAHNAYRETVRDKQASEKAGRDVMLEPIRIKDLRMVVAVIAPF